MCYQCYFYLFSIIYAILYVAVVVVRLAVANFYSRLLHFMQLLLPQFYISFHAYIYLCVGIHTYVYKLYMYVCICVFMMPDSLSAATISHMI